MLVLISPSKSQDFNSIYFEYPSSDIMFRKKTSVLLEVLKKLTVSELSSLMKISNKLAGSVHEMYVKFSSSDFNKDNSRPALFAFTGDVYKSMEVHLMNNNDLNFIRNKLLIISGFYGLLRPFDLIQQYRLDMGTRIVSKQQIGLYEFWSEILTKKVNEVMEFYSYKSLINLASSEYTKVFIKKNIAYPWVDIIFKEHIHGTYKNIGLYAKRARGLMVNFIVKNNIQDVKYLKEFDLNGYSFNVKFSSANQLCFTRFKRREN